MKVLARLFITLSLCFMFSASTNAGFFDDFISGGDPSIRYCNDEGECGLQEGIDVIKDGINDIEKDRTASEYIQDIVIFVLSFVTIVGVIYIIYAGAMILIGNGDEEKLKSSRQIIIYVIIGIVIMWLAYPIVSLILNILNTSS